MKKILLTLLVLSVIFFTGCFPAKKKSSSDIVILPLGGEVTVTDGSIVYALPLTVFEIDVMAERTIEIPGPYAMYASDMLGLEDVIREETEYWSISSVSLNTVEELDPSQYYVIQGTTLMQTNALALKRSGLVLDISPEIYSSSAYSHDLEGFDISGLVYPDLGADEYVTFRTDTAFKVIKADTAFIRVPYLVEKKRKPSREEEASAAAKKLLELREGKHMLLTGETNVFPQDAAAIDEINRLDNEYTALFAGKSYSERRHYRFWITPEPSMTGKNTVIFNFSETGGVFAAGDNTGEPVYIELTPSGKTSNLNLVVRPVVSEDELGAHDKLYYRVPDVVDIRIFDENETLCTARKLVYQFGNTVALPANFIIGK